MNKHFSFFTFLLCISTFLLFLYPSVLYAVTPTIELETGSGYDIWKPTDGGKITFTVVVKNLHDPAEGFSEGKVTLSFPEVITSWSGICMNSPRLKPQDTPDLRFYPKDQAVLGNTLKWDSPIWNDLVGHPNTSDDSAVKDSVGVVFTSKDNLDTFSFTITVRCEDYGAFGILVATLVSSDPSKPFSASVLKAIPKDDNGDYRADAYDPVARNPAEDEEKGPGENDTGVHKNTQKGDGLSVFEEYRGFMIGGIPKRLNVEQKDIFIHSPYSEFDDEGLEKSGIGGASALPNKFDKHEILTNEVKNPEEYTEKDENNELLKKITDRTVNFNALSASAKFDLGDDWRIMPKEAFWVVKDPTTYGENSNRENYLGLSDDGVITVFTAHLGSKNDASLEAKLLAITLGHEIDHAKGLKHPWDSAVGINAASEVIGRVPQIPNSEKEGDEYSILFPDAGEGEIDPNLVLAKRASGWIGLYAFDNRTDSFSEIKRRYQLLRSMERGR